MDARDRAFLSRFEGKLMSSSLSPLAEVYPLDSYSASKSFGEVYF